MNLFLGVLYCVVHQVGSKTTLRLSEIEFVGFAERNETVVYHLWLRAQKDELHHLLRFKHVFPDSPPLLVLDMGFSAQILSTLGTIPSTGLLGISFALQVSSSDAPLMQLQCHCILVKVALR